MNYIIHLNAFLEKAAKEEWMVPHHYSLYMALFNTWNKLGFRKTIYVRREEIMRAAKIKSKCTYYRSLRELAARQYLVYQPSASRFTPATVSMVPMGIRNEPLQVPPKGPLLETKIKSISNDVSNGLPTMDEVIAFFTSYQYSQEEARKFWYHHEATGWLSGNTPVQHWQPLAHKWMLKSPQFKNDEDYNQSF
ncbi:hypothetical protein [Chitinophaga sp. LS1]|uniref:hypothetical protein n=1 Tax=Chitinophaga sp. LS1 TaxID=3051176 RepID=UPI002AAB3424|nr:hypothetical protein [Chitinophaga sp. LS1]WPV67837.1 hypothetical protein QQL36_03755 [Chitinophaga sp. LS1]